MFELILRHLTWYSLCKVIEITSEIQRRQMRELSSLQFNSIQFNSIQFNSIQFKFICIALFTIQIVAKQLYRKLSFYNIYQQLISGDCQFMYIWQKCTEKSIKDIIKQTMNTINSNYAIKFIAKFGSSICCFRVSII